MQGNAKFPLLYWNDHSRETHWSVPCFTCFLILPACWPKNLVTLSFNSRINYAFSLPLSIHYSASDLERSLACFVMFCLLFLHKLYAAIFASLPPFIRIVRITRQPQKYKFCTSVNKCYKNILSALSFKIWQSLSELHQLENISNKNLEILKKFFKNGQSLEFCDQRWSSWTVFLLEDSGGHKLESYQTWVFDRLSTLKNSVLKNCYSRIEWSFLVSPIFLYGFLQPEKRRVFLKIRQ